jgi:T4 RNase H, C terminal
LTVDDPEAYLKEHILRGDRGDGIPNFMSADDTFVTGERQKVLNKKRMDQYMAAEEFETENLRRGFKRNQTLIDFEYIPERIRTAVLDAYSAARPATYDKLLNYFMDKGLKYMIENASDF